MYSNIPNSFIYYDAVDNKLVQEDGINIFNMVHKHEDKYFLGFSIVCEI